MIETAVLSRRGSWKSQIGRNDLYTDRSRRIIAVKVTAADVETITRL